MIFNPVIQKSNIEYFEIEKSGTEDDFGNITTEFEFPFWDFSLLQVTIWSDSAVNKVSAKLTNTVRSELVLGADLSLEAGEKNTVLFLVVPPEGMPGTKERSLFNAANDRGETFEWNKLFFVTDIGDSVNGYDIWVNWPTNGSLKHVKYKFIKFT